MSFLNKIFKSKKSSHQELHLIDQNENEYYLKGNLLIQPFMQIDGIYNRATQKDFPKIRDGIKYLDAVTTINPNNFAAYWIKGKGYQIMRQHDLAYLEFKKSFELKKDNPDVARELMIECTHLGKGNEAVELALHALSLDNSNSGLVGNLALAYLINGEMNLAKTTINQALSVNPNDTINLTLNEVIDEVISGKRKIPSKYDELS